MPGVNTALSRRRKNLRREFDAIVGGNWYPQVDLSVYPERLRSRADLIAELREINAHLPFADPIQPWYEPFDDWKMSLMMRMRFYYGSVVQDPHKIIFVSDAGS